jgi:predicted transcriptional regulator
MTNDTVPRGTIVDSDTVTLTPTAKTALYQIAAALGRPIEEVLEAAIGEYRHRHTPPVTHIDGVDPADVWAAYEEVQAGLVTDHATVMAELQARK